MECSEASHMPDVGKINILSKSVDASQPADSGDGKVQAPMVLSPNTQAKLQFILDRLQNQEAFFGEDSNGRPTIEYKKEKVLYLDKSEANKIQTARVYSSQEETENKKKLLVDAALEHIQYLKQNVSPQGVVLDPSKVVPSKAGQYEEGSEFTRTKEILGKGNIAGDIVLIRDKTTDSTAALKTIMISVFRKEEIQAWVDLNDTGYVPCLYLFKLKGNKVDVVMEPLKEAISLTSIIDEHIWKIREANPALVKPFSLYMFHGLMTAAQTMHDKGWTHRDLHSGNVMVQKGSDVNVPLKIRILDFGNAGRRDDKDGFKGFRMDIAEIVRKFTAMYLGNEFDSEVDIRRDSNRDTKLNESADLLGISREERDEIFKLIDTALQITSVPDFQDFQEQLKDKLPPQQDMNEILKEVVQLLFFPFEYQSVHPVPSSGLTSMDRAFSKKLVILEQQLLKGCFFHMEHATYIFRDDRKPAEDVTVADCADGPSGTQISDDILNYFRQTIRIG